MQNEQWHLSRGRGLQAQRRNNSPGLWDGDMLGKSTALRAPQVVKRGVAALACLRASLHPPRPSSLYRAIFMYSNSLGHAAPAG